MNKQRLIVFDLIKTIAIYLVVFGHCCLYLKNGKYDGDLVYQVTNLISVPLFFLVSGYFAFKQKEEMSWSDMQRKVYRLLIPYFFWSVFYYFFCNWIGINTYPTTLGLFIKGLIVAPYFSSPIWFLRTLFLQFLLLYLCLKVPMKNKLIPIFLSWLVVICLAQFITPNFGLQSVAANYGLFILGYAFNRYSLLTKKWMPILGLGSVLGFGILFYLKMQGIFPALTFKACNFLGVIGTMYLICIFGKSIISGGGIQLFGSKTLQIYTVHFAFIYMMAYFDFPVPEQFYIFWIILYSIIVFFLSGYFAILIEKIKWFNPIFGNIPVSKRFSCKS